MTWKIERWGGNANHKRRVVFLGSEDRAREKYGVLAAALRQGLVELIDCDGRTIQRTAAPRLRTQW